MGRGVVWVGREAVELIILEGFSTAGSDVDPRNSEDMLGAAVNPAAETKEDDAALG